MSVIVRWIEGEELRRGAMISWPMKPPAPVMRICCVLAILVFGIGRLVIVLVMGESELLCLNGCLIG